MSRTKTFDRQAVLQAAMRVFWQKGYDATSMQDLLDATGLSRSSLYEEFEDKAHLFEAATRCYFDMHGQLRVRALREATSVRGGLQAFFDLQIAACLHPEDPPGCLLTNTATTLASHDGRIAELVRASTEGLRQEILALLRRGQAAGQLSAQADVEALSHLVMSVSLGINVWARMHADRAALEAMARGAVNAVGG